MTRSEKFWDGMAENFDKGESNFEPIHLKAIENARKHLSASDVVLDYGCATGTKAFELAGHVKSIEGIDISPKMIAVAQRRANEGHIENVTFAQATLFDERYQRESFDVILAFNILHLLKDNQETIRRVSELLKPGGRFISATPCLGEKKALRTALQFYPALLLSKIGVIPQYLKRFNIPELEALIVNGNLQIVDSEKLYHKLTNYFVVARKT